MGVTRTFAGETDQCFQQVEKLTNSHSLRGSESLCKLLRFLAENSLAQPPSRVKEYQIATEVFGRSTHFDSHSDSTVRVQAGRLRTKLAEYYASEGVDDPIVVELPKGSYVLSFHHRAVEPKAAVGPSIQQEHEATPVGKRRWQISGVAASVLVVFLVGLIVERMAHRPVAANTLGIEGKPAPAALRTLWRPFVAAPDEPLVVFSNAAFVGRPETGMRYYDAARDQQKQIWDHYTGVGEVLAVDALEQAFGQLHHRIRVKRGSLFSLDDAKNNNLIFVGSPSENLTLQEIPNTHEFIFQRLASGPRRGDLAIMNVHPQDDEPKYFVASPSNVPLTEDYAVIGLLPGLNPPQEVMILAGTTTFGTQGAAEYVCRENSLEQLLQRLSESSNGEVKQFEALLRVKIARGVPVDSELVAVRKRANTQSQSDQETAKAIHWVTLKLSS